MALQTWLQDVPVTLRGMRRRPAQALVAIAVLAVAIAANAVVFSALNAFLLRPLPYPDDDRLVMVYNSYPKIGVPVGGSSIPDYMDRRAQAPSLEELAIVTPAPQALTGDGPAEQLAAVRASPSLFTVLAVAPALGRAFTEDEATIGNERVVVISDSLWRRRFGADAGLVGRDIELDGLRHRVIGVMPPGFGFPDRNIDAWVPFTITPEQLSEQQRGNDFSITVGRLRDGATIDGLESELAGLIRRLAESNPRFASIIEDVGFTGRASLLRETVVGDLEQTLLLLQGIVLVVLLIACANVASLQLARVVARRRELAVRAALGAERGRLARLVVTETVLLSTVGAVVGFTLARIGLDLVAVLGIDKSAQGVDVVLDSHVALFTAAAGVFGSLIAALMPLAAIAREDLAHVVNETGRSVAGRQGASAFRKILVVTQVAASFTLLVVAGLLTKSFYQIQSRGPGFEAEGVLTAAVTLPRNGRYMEAEARGQFYARLVDGLAALPGVTAAGFTSELPFSGTNSGATIAIEGYEQLDGEPPPVARLRSVSEEFLASLGIPLVAGRHFSPGESQRVAIVDEAFANRYWPADSALGQRVRNDVGPPDEWSTIVGVVPQVRHESLVEAFVEGTIYFHYLQQPGARGYVTIRTALPPAGLTQAAASVVESIDPDVPLYQVMTMDARVADALGPQRAPMVLTLIFAGIAFTLAVSGLYGVLTWVVNRRVGEIGVRMALGARAGDIVRMVLWNGSMLVVVGLGVGVACTLGLEPLVAAQVYGVSPSDPVVFAISAGSLGIAALLASWIPARRAARIEPSRALREE